MQKVLYVGEERICRQVAYVLNYKEYEIVEKLTEEKYEKYKSEKIYVCEFKNRSKLIVEKGLRGKKEVNYLKQICHAIDKEYYINLKQKKDLRRQYLSWFGYLKIKIRDFLKLIYCKVIGCLTLNAVKNFRYDKFKKHKKRIIRHLKSRLKPSKLFLYVLYAPVNPDIQCSLIEKHLVVDRDANVFGCFGSVYFGNLLVDGELDDIYHSVFARIIKLSSLNGSYCLCNLGEGCSCITLSEKKTLNKFVSPKVPESMINSIDQSCNLCCKSCRNKFYVMSDTTHKKINLISNKLISSNYLNQTNTLIIAGMGEVLYSPYYRQLLESGLQRESIRIVSNGTLFNQDNWNWLKDKYKIIDVEVSVDAATAETYQKLRGANFNKLLENLKMLGKLHREGKIRKYIFNFVIQRDNFREMPDFVRLAKTLGVDSINFQHMNNFGNLKKKQFLEKRLIINNEYFDHELWKILQDPIFQDPIVDLRIIKPYLEASNKRYK